ncbi:NADPH-dependent F420 reductase [Dictyobacter kobayashii]|uniref:NADP oxidoreductase n=1 Tax=Dictyobacter kobayashii TaxID=2014872 RepID=A0A402AXV7_9CHLR|nr:NAD(P)-binding domain-containing protein [Dictyobacter kobayashii]GCE23952.1 NADP oxidoreductase [Dictyobacter kobayashii]
MNIGIIGSGNIGANAAKLFAKAGHKVAISNSKGPASLAGLVSEIGPNAKATTTEEAVKFGDAILVALPWTKRNSLPPAQMFENKIVMDATNPYVVDKNGNFGLDDLGNSTSSEEILKLMPGARLVKAFNTMYFETLRTGSSTNPEQRLVLFIAGDDSEAKEIVARLIEDIGFAAVDTGFLHDGGRLQQPGSPIYNVPMTVEQAKQKLTDIS